MQCNDEYDLNLWLNKKNINSVVLNGMIAIEHDHDARVHT